MDILKNIKDIGSVLSDANQYISNKGAKKNVVADYINELKEIINDFFVGVKKDVDMGAFKNQNAITKIFKLLSDIKSTLKNDSLFLTKLPDFIKQYNQLSKEL
jgi:hypothetical protein